MKEITIKTPYTKLLYLVRTNKLSVLKSLLVENSHLDVNHKYGVGWTLLHSASIRGYTDTVRFLLDAGADPNTANHRGQTPFDLLLQGGSDRAGFEEMLNLFREHAPELVFSKFCTMRADP